MAIDDLAGLTIGALRFLYRVGTFFISVGLFLLVVSIFKDSANFGVIPLRMVVAGFGFEFIVISAWRARVTGALFLFIAVIPTPFYLRAYAYLK